MDKLFLALAFCLVSLNCVAQDYTELSKSFYKNEALFKQDADMHKLFKQSKNRNITAHVLGGISIASLVGGAIIIRQLDSNSDDLAIVFTILGAAALASVSGTIGIIFKINAGDKKWDAINMYDMRYGYKPIQKQSQVSFVNLNLKGVGLSLSINF